MKKYCLLLLLLGAVFSPLSAANTHQELTLYKEKINHAITKFEQTKRALWSYSISRYEDEEGDISSSIEQHSPQSTQPWLLKRINGQPPTEQQIKQFIKKKKQQTSAKNQGKNMQLSLRQLINLPSLTLVSTDHEHIVMAFKVDWDKLGKDSVGKLQGKLIYQKDQEFIEQITIWNNADFSPIFTANITDLAITFTFIQINGAVVAKQNEMKMKGSFAYFTEINETSLDRFSDYIYQGY